MHTLVTYVSNRKLLQDPENAWQPYECIILLTKEEVTESTHSLPPSYTEAPEAVAVQVVLIYYCKSK
jgi:hypothetical protein